MKKNNVAITYNAQSKKSAITLAIKTRAEDHSKTFDLWTHGDDSNLADMCDPLITKER